MICRDCGFNGDGTCSKCIYDCAYSVNLYADTKQVRSSMGSNSIVFISSRAQWIIRVIANDFFQTTEGFLQIFRRLVMHFIDILCYSFWSIALRLATFKVGSRRRLRIWRHKATPSFKWKGRPWFDDIAFAVFICAMSFAGGIMKFAWKTFLKRLLHLYIKEYSQSEIKDAYTKRGFSET